MGEHPFVNSKSGESSQVSARVAPVPVPAPAAGESGGRCDANNNKYKNKKGGIREGGQEPLQSPPATRRKERFFSPARWKAKSEPGGGEEKEKEEGSTNASTSSGAPPERSGR